MIFYMRWRWCCRWWRRSSMPMMSGRCVAFHFLKMMAGRGCAAFNMLVLMITEEMCNGHGSSDMVMLMMAGRIQLWRFLCWWCWWCLGGAQRYTSRRWWLGGHVQRLISWCWWWLGGGATLTMATRRGGDVQLLTFRFPCGYLQRRCKIILWLTVYIKMPYML